MKKCLAVLLALCLLFPFGNVVLAEQNQKEAEVSESEVLEFAKEFVDETYKTLKPMDFQELSKKYLKPGNELFNTEMEVRNAVDHSTVRDFKNNGLEITLFEHEFKKVELRERFTNLYRVELDFEEIWDTSEHKFDSKDPEKTYQGLNRSVIVTLENESRKLYVTDLYGLNDGISFRLNKNFMELKSLKEEVQNVSTKVSSKKGLYLNSTEPNGISPKKAEDEMEEEVTEKIYTSAEELKNAQFQNLANIREELTAPPAMSLDEDNTKPDITPMATSYSLDYAKCGAWARAFAMVSQADYARATNYRFIHLGNVDCANFASQVVYAGCRVFKDTGNKYTSWYAYNHGKDRSHPWSYARKLSDFLNTNDGKGPYCWRRTWMKENNISDNTLYPGDLVFLCETKGGNAFHTLAISEEGGRNRAIFCSHSNPRRSNSLGQLILKEKDTWFYGLNLKYRK